MSQRTSGLRFDIYERVFLPEWVAGIQELDEVELVPEIEVTPIGEQALLRGHLILNGKYESGTAESRTSETLRHLIPVEITLPMERVRSIESISVEIENFDVDVISARSLNVTGVLSLNGIETPAAPPEEWSEDEEIVFVHDADAAEPNAGSPQADRTSGTEQQSGLFRDEIRPEAEAAAGQPASPGRAEEAADDEPKEELSDSDIIHDEIAENENMNPFEEEEMTDSAPNAGENEGSAEAESDLQNHEFHDDEPQELKIAFGSKPPSPESEEKIKWQNWLYRNEGDAASAADAEAADTLANGALPDSAAEDVEWKRLFLSYRSESRPFRKLKLCIVQKNETLDSIAERYGIKPQEIQLYNKLGLQQDVSEGQVLYIPSVS